MQVSAHLGKQDLIDKMAVQLGLTKTKASECLNTVLDLIKEEASTCLLPSASLTGLFRLTQPLVRRWPGEVTLR